MSSGISLRFFIVALSEPDASEIFVDWKISPLWLPKHICSRIVAVVSVDFFLLWAGDGVVDTVGHLRVAFGDAAGIV